MKKLLILGAMQMHVSIIKRAKERGIYVITCDYIPENIGHTLADEAYFDSTTDFDAILKRSQECVIDGIMTFNSDPAALTAAYVAEKLGLPGSGYAAVEIMSEKDKFRNFLFENGFNVPKYGYYTNANELICDISDFNLPVLVKPVDSSGSKGIAIVKSIDDIVECFQNAMFYSRCKRVIVEEYIEAKLFQLHGDAFISNGVIQFCYLGDHHFNTSVNNLVPISTTFPSLHSATDIEMVESEVQRFVSLVGYKSGGVNIEVRIGKDNKVYLIEVGARNGGNYVPIITQFATGYNFIDAALDLALGKDYQPQEVNKGGYYAHFMIHSPFSGILERVEIAPSIASKVIDRYDNVHVGGEVRTYKGSNAVIGVILLKFNAMSEMQEFIENHTEYCKVVLK